KLTQTVDRFGEPVLERASAQLAVGQHLEAACLLEHDRLVDRTVLDSFELGRGKLAVLEALARYQQLRRPLQAADDLGMRIRHAPRLPGVAWVQPAILSPALNEKPLLNGGSGAPTAGAGMVPYHGSHAPA